MNRKMKLFLMMTCSVLSFSFAHADPVATSTPAKMEKPPRLIELNRPQHRPPPGFSTNKPERRKPQGPVVLTEEQKGCYSENGVTLEGPKTDRKTMDPSQKRKIYECLKKAGFKRPVQKKEP